MFDETVAVTDDVLTDYLFGQLELDGQIRVEHALSKNPELAAKLAGCKARMLAIQRLTEATLDPDIPASFIDALKPLLEDQRLALRPEQMATSLAAGHPAERSNGQRGNGVCYREVE